MAMMQQKHVQNAIEFRNDVDSMPIAATGFWSKENVLIDCVVPKINGVGCARLEKAATPLHQSKHRMLAAKGQAEVGEDIRWDVIFQEAVKFPCGLNEIKPGKGDSDDGMSTSAGGSIDSDADTDYNSGNERAKLTTLGKATRCNPQATKSSSISQSESRVYSIVTMLRVWDVCCRCPSTPPADPDSKPTTPPPGLAAPPGLSAPPGFPSQMSSSIPRSTKTKNIPRVDSQKAGTTGNKAPNSKKDHLERLLKVMKEEQGATPPSAPLLGTSGKAPWRRNATDPSAKVLETAPWRRGKQSAMPAETMGIAPPPGL